MQHTNRHIGFLLFLLTLCTNATAFPMQNPPTTEAQDQSYQKADDAECKQPVCWAGDDREKSCYICEYGKPAQHVVCTSKGSHKDQYYDEARAQNAYRNSCPAPSDKTREKHQDKAPTK